MPEGDRRDFLKQGLAMAAGATALPLMAAGEPGKSVVLSRPINVKVVEHTESTDADRTEMRSKLELSGSNGALHRVTSYMLKIDREETYDTTIVIKTDKYSTAGDSAPAESDLRIVVVSGDKGAVEGDTRKDEIQITTFGPEGIHKTPLRSVNKSLVDPYEGLPIDERAQAYFDDSLNRSRR